MPLLAVDLVIEDMILVVSWFSDKERLWCTLLRLWQERNVLLRPLQLTKRAKCLDYALLLGQCKPGLICIWLKLHHLLSGHTMQKKIDGRDAIEVFLLQIAIPTSPPRDLNLEH